jgi:acetylornithine deacetylase/succinyl-diaminopimelate desuccinylase-like protein
VPYARAKLSLRIHPEQDPEEAQAALIQHLEGLRPFGIPLEVEAGEIGKGFAAKTSGPAYEAAHAALAAAWGSEAVTVATGGSIPLVNALQEAAPDAEILLLGTTDGFANIHAPNERVVLDEFEKAVVAEAEFFRRFADAAKTGGATS